MTIVSGFVGLHNCVLSNGSTYLALDTGERTTDIPSMNFFLYYPQEMKTNLGHEADMGRDFDYVRVTSHPWSAIPEATLCSSLYSHSRLLIATPPGECIQALLGLSNAFPKLVFDRIHKLSMDVVYFVPTVVPSVEH